MPAGDWTPVVGAHHGMSATAKAFKKGRSLAIRLPKAFRVASPEVRLSRAPDGILISETDPWERFG